MENKDIQPNEYSLKCLFNNYHEERCALKAENRKGHIDFATMYDEQEKIKNKYVQMVKLIFSKSNLSYGELMTIETFIQYQKDGSFISYDGSGYYLDWEGNRLGSINWYNYNGYPEVLALLPGIINKRS